MLGKALERFAGKAVPRAARGRLILAWLRETVQDPQVRDIAPRLLERMITEGGTKRPVCAAELAQEAGSAPSVTRGCLNWLALRGLVREIDRERDVWEIAHDFVARLLLAIVARMRPSPWHHIQPVLAWGGLGLWLLAFVLTVYAWPEWFGEGRGSGYACSSAGWSCTRSCR